MVLMGGHSENSLWSGELDERPPVPMVMTGGHSENSLWSGELDERPQFLWYWRVDILRTHCGVVNWMKAPSSYCIDGWTFWELIVEWWTGWRPPVPIVLTGGHSENSLWSGELDEGPQFLLYWRVDILRTHCGVVNWMKAPSSYCIDGWTFWELIVEWWTGWRPPSSYCIDGWTFWEFIVEWWTGWTPPVPMVLMGGYSQELTVEWWTGWTPPVPIVLTGGHSQELIAEWWIGWSLFHVMTYSLFVKVLPGSVMAYC